MTATLEQCLRARDLAYRLSEEACGCCWHILIEDGNVHANHVRFCIVESVRCDKPWKDACLALGPLILAMSTTQRLKLFHGGYEAAAIDAQRKGEYPMKIGEPFDIESDRATDAIEAINRALKEHGLQCEDDAQPHDGFVRLSLVRCPVKLPNDKGPRAMALLERVVEADAHGFDGIILIGLKYDNPRDLNSNLDFTFGIHTPTVQPEGIPRIFASIHRAMEAQKK